MKKHICIGLDIGTTAIKIICIDTEGNTIWSQSLAHDLLTPSAGFAEEDTSIWEEHTYQLLRELVQALSEEDLASIDAIGLTGMVPTLIALDENYFPLRNSIQQQDNRAIDELEYLKTVLDPSWVFKHTGNRLNQQHLAPKLLWLKKHESEVFKQMRHIMGSYDYIRYILCGVPSLERNWALESGLYSLQTQTWLDDMLATCEIDASMLPPIKKSDEVVGTTTEKLNRLTGFPVGVKVVAGSADHIASAFSTGARNNGDLVLKLGGAGDILFSIDTLVTDDRMFIDYQCDGSDHYMLNGCTATSGSLLKWFKKEAQLPEFETMDDAAAAIGPLSDGVVVLPYFLGEKTPIFDVHAKGVIYGLSLSHTKVHIYRAILEAVAYSFRHHVEVFKERGLSVERVYITNGGSKSTIWRSILADVLGYDVRYIPKHPGSCLGGAILAAIGAKVADTTLVDTFLQQSIYIPHNEENHEKYDKGYQMYRALYENLKDLMANQDLDMTV